MDKRFNKDECFQAARVACENAFPSLSRRQQDGVKEDTKPGLSATEVNPRSSTQSKYTMSRLSPALAAAMLSLPWPPPGNSSEINADLEASEMFEEYEKPIPGKMANPKSVLSRSSRRFARKKKSIKTSTDDHENNAERGYIPFRIPQFHEVHTNWPGFDHEPVPNWQEKYLYAKPYPKKVEDLPPPVNVLSQPSYTVTNVEGYENNTTSILPQLKPADNSPSRLQAGKMKGDGKNKPKSRLHIERIGSCMK